MTISSLKYITVLLFSLKKFSQKEIFADQVYWQNFQVLREFIFADIMKIHRNLFLHILLKPICETQFCVKKRTYFYIKHQIFQTFPFQFRIFTTLFMNINVCNSFQSENVNEYMNIAPSQGLRPTLSFPGSQHLKQLLQRVEKNNFLFVLNRNMFFCGNQFSRN